jgi:hypothetical protein
MCWVAVDRGLCLADKRSFPADRNRWLQVRDEIYEDIQAHVPKANELWRGRFDAEVASEHPLARRCTVGAIEERIPGEQHGIQALTSTLLGEIPTAIDVDAVGLRDELETGPVWAVIGEESRQVRFLAAYLDDLGALLAIPGSELVTRDELRTVLDEQFAGDWPGVWVRSAKNFAPQVQDSEQRYGWGYTPIFSVGDRYSHETGPFARRTPGLRPGSRSRRPSRPPRVSCWRPHLARRGPPGTRLVSHGPRDRPRRPSR